MFDQIGRNDYEIYLTDSRLEQNKADEDYSEDEVKESFIKNKENVNAKVYVKQVDTIDEVQSIIRQHETKYTLNTSSIMVRKILEILVRYLIFTYLSDVFNLVCFSLH